MAWRIPSKFKEADVTKTDLIPPPPTLSIVGTLHNTESISTWLYRNLGDLGVEIQKYRNLGDLGVEK